MVPAPLTRKQAHYIKQLKAKKYRLQEGAFLVQGKKNVKDLLHSHYVTQMVVATPSFIDAEGVMLAKASCPIYMADPDLLAQISTLKTNHQVLAVVTTQVNKPLIVERGECALALDTIKDPGNLGTIMRIADWYGITKLICSPTTVERYNPKVIQSSMGSFTHIESYYTALLPYLKAAQVPVIGAIVESTHYLHQAKLPKEGILVIGNESHGIEATLRPYLDMQVAIQPHGKADSLNAAIATAIICERWRT